MSAVDDRVNVWRSALAIAAGFTVTALLVTFTDLLVARLAPQLYPDVTRGAQPTATGLALNLAYGTLYAVLGGFVMALIARRQVMKHLYWLIAVLVVFGVISALQYAGVMPPWYSVAVVALGIVGYWLGAQAYLRTRGEGPAESAGEAPSGDSAGGQ